MRGTANPDRQFVWGLRYIDNFVLRDRDTDSNGSLDERLYALQDANRNVTALADSSGDVQERYAYSAYGTPRVLTPTFTTRASSSFHMEVSFAGYRFDWESGQYHVRNRMYHAELGRWLQRDQVGYVDGVNLYEYCTAKPILRTDPSGSFALAVEGCALFPPCWPLLPWVIAAVVVVIGVVLLVVILRNGTRVIFNRCQPSSPPTFAPPRPEPDPTPKPKPDPRGPVDPLPPPARDDGAWHCCVFDCEGCFWVEVTMREPFPCSKKVYRWDGPVMYHCKNTDDYPGKCDGRGLGLAWESRSL